MKRYLIIIDYDHEIARMFNRGERYRMAEEDQIRDMMKFNYVIPMSSTYIIWDMKTQTAYYRQ